MSLTDLFLRVSGASVALSGLSSLFSVMLPSLSRLVAASMALGTVWLQERQLISDLRSLTQRPSRKRMNRLRGQSGYKGRDMSRLESISWQQHHRRSGLRVAKYLGKLSREKTPPPLAAILSFLSRLSFSIPGGYATGKGFPEIGVSFPCISDAGQDHDFIDPGAQSSPSSASSCTPSTLSSHTCNLPFHQAASALGLPLYGCLDHNPNSIDQDLQITSMLWTLALFIRAIYLMACFAPFIFIGIPLSLVSIWLSSSGRESQGAISTLRCMAWRLLLFGCRMTGAATIKWAQWSATRGDLFDDDFCRIMSSLHSSAPTHSYAHTKMTVEAALHCPLSEAFVTFDAEPLASASIAQVHRATRRRVHDSEDLVEEVIVKVSHPNVAEHIRKDFAIFKMVASLISGLRVFKGLPIKESIAMFSSTMTAQTDFRVEAAHLERFFVNFQGTQAYAHGPGSDKGGMSTLRSHITTPRPLWASEAVLIETFERGRSVSQFMGTRGPFNSEIVSLGVSCYLSMLLRDRFVHQDLHPGNIIARTPSGDSERDYTELVLLDFGLAEQLDRDVQHRFVAFLSSICSGDGRAASDILLSWTAQEQQCPDPGALRRDMISLFETECDRGPGSRGVDLDKVMKSILKLARKHEVTIDSSYAALCISVCVIIGFATSLDPTVNVIDAATSCILAWRLTGKVIGNLC